MPKILVIDDDAASCRTLKLHYGQRGFEVDTASNAGEGLGKLLETPADVVVSDIRMPGRSGLELLEDIRERLPDVPVIMITAFQDLDSTVAAMHGGAVDYVPKPIDIDELDEAVDKALKIRAEDDSEGLIIDSGEAGGTIIGRSRAMKEVFKSIGMVSQSRVTALVLGESGTGKELVARAIHMASPDATAPFVAVNCAALVETLLESEMFGHERGAFTGAVSARKGKVEQAGNGTLFLDEIGE
ncbi:MAG: sigma-54-dependent Fis family transcriptional regulator, partial [Alphaproteobacteria bacterium]|nr:sigma-54-dependent Fis family transcriptional regulator [Alphaproteobacteria bacterium]